MNDYAKLGDVRNAELSYEKLRKLQGGNRTEGCWQLKYNMQVWPPKPACLHGFFMVDNLVLRRRKPVFFMVLGAHEIYFFFVFFWCSTLVRRSNLTLIFFQVGKNHWRRVEMWQINTLIKACSNAGNLERAEYWNQYLEKMGMQQNDMGFGKLMEAGTTMWADPSGCWWVLSGKIRPTFMQDGWGALPVHVVFSMSWLKGC